MIPFPDKKYQIIYADPPWSFTAWNPKTAHKYIEKQYKTMTEKELVELPVKNISEENSVLFLWSTFPNLKMCLNVMEKWGFTYKTCAFNWVKRNKKSDSWFWGMGYYTRSNSEVCLLGVRGKPLKRLSHSIHQIIDHKIMEHSKKPDIVREKIVELFGDLPRIELFARPPQGELFEDESYKGWDVWGNEVQALALRRSCLGLDDGERGAEAGKMTTC